MSRIIKALNFANPTRCKCYAVPKAGSLLIPSTITRRAAQPMDVVIGIKYAGVCHSDIHQAHGEWGKLFYIIPFIILKIKIYCVYSNNFK